MTALIARLVLAGVFLVAALAKLADRGGTREAVVSFGVPARFAGPVALAVPLAELTVAALLLPASTAIAGALAALILLALFSGAISFALARGEAPDCNCFGALSERRVSRWTLGRNAALAAVAAFAAVAGPGESATAWLGELEPAARGWAIAALALAATALALAWLAVVLLRRHGRVLMRLDALEAELGVDPSAARLGENHPLPELAVGEEAPELTAHDLEGERVTLDTLLEPGKPLALFFTDPACSVCDPLLPRIAEWQRGPHLRIAVISRGSVPDTRAKRDEHGLRDVLVQAGDSISLDFRAYGMPSAVLVSEDGTIASGVALGDDAVARLLGDAFAAQMERS